MEHEPRILILEAAHTDAEVIELQLRKSGIPFQAKSVGSKEMFLREMAERAPDIVVADTAIPRTDVVTLLRESRVSNPKTKWIIVSGTGTEELAVESMKAGAADYVPKKNLGRLGASLKAIVETPEKTRPSEPPAEHPPEEEGPAGAPSDRLFRDIVENADDLIAVLDLQGRRVYNSAAYSNLLEEPDILEGTSSFVDIHPEDRERVRNVFQETVASGQGQRLEYRLMDRNGNVRYIESQGSVIKDAEGNPEYVAIISRDITSRRLAGEIQHTVQAEIERYRGDEFFPGVVRALAGALGVGYVLVSECVDQRRQRVRSLAYWAAGALAPDFEYDVKDTTCEEVVQAGKTKYFPSNVQELFPREAALSAMNVSSYLGTPLLDAEGIPIGHLFIMHDQAIPRPDLAISVLTITAARAAAELEHRRAIRRLEETQKRDRTILEEVADGVILTDLEDVITYVNGSLARMTGFETEEMIGKLASTLLVADEDRRDLYLRNDRRRSGVSERYETVLNRIDGSRFRAVISAVPHRNDSGAIIGTLAVVSPGALTEKPTPGISSGHEIGLLEKAQDPVYVCDPEDHILFWNSAAAQLFGWTAEEVRGKTSTELLQSDAPGLPGGAAHTAVVEGYWAGELSQRRKDGTSVLVDSRWTLIRDSEGQPKSLLVICTDITGEKELDVYELRARRMEGITSLVSAIAADLDRLLTPVLLAVPTLEEKANDENSRQAVALVESSAHRGIDLGAQVLALADNAGGGEGLLDSEEFLAETIRGVSESLPQSITLQSSLSSSGRTSSSVGVRAAGRTGNLWPIRGTVAQLQQVILNICTNAREAMPDGGELNITGENILVDAQTYHAGASVTPGKYVVISIGDNGRGIAPEILGHVFEPFFTTKEPGRTVGLGLSTASAIVRNHKGFINIFSEPQKGTIVKIYLPAGGIEGEGGSEKGDLHLGHGECILVVEAEATLRDIMRKILEAHGYQTLGAGDGAEALAVVKRGGQGARLALVDLEMPYMDGAETVRFLKKANPTLPIIAIGTTQGKLDKGLAGTLSRPFTTRALLQAVSKSI
jgi:PAS domain S-box-containing protein